MAETEEKTLSGLTASEAREFHQLYVQGFLIFTGIAAFAHFLVWLWRPWIPGPQGYASLADGVKLALDTVSTFIA